MRKTNLDLPPLTATSGAVAAVRAGSGQDWRGSIPANARACCCPATPVFKVVLPARPGLRPPVDLLLCAHHYRASRDALVAVGADTYDAAGRLLDNSLYTPFQP